MKRLFLLVHSASAASVAALVVYGMTGLDPTDAASSVAAGQRVWTLATWALHLGFLAQVAVAARWRAAGLSGWRGGAVHAAAWVHYLLATLVVWGGYGDALLRFRKDVGLWAGEFNGAAFGMIVAWPTAAVVAALAWGIAGFLAARGAAASGG